MSYYFGSHNSYLHATPSIKPPMTVSFWAKHPADGLNFAGGNITIMQSGTTPRFEIVARPAIDSDSNLYWTDCHDGTNRRVIGKKDMLTAVQTWHHICVAIGATSIPKLYVNGVESTTVYRSDGSSFSWGTNMTIMQIGGSDGSTVPQNYIAPGYMAEVGIWTSELSSTDVSNLYTDKYAPIIVQNSSLYAYWDLLRDAEHVARAGSPEGGTGLIDQKNALDLTAVSTAAGNVDHPSDMVYTLAASGGLLIPRGLSGGMNSLSGGIDG